MEWKFCIVKKKKQTNRRDDTVRRDKVSFAIFFKIVSRWPTCAKDSFLQRRLAGNSKKYDFSFFLIIKKFIENFLIKNTLK